MNPYVSALAAMGAYTAFALLIVHDANTVRRVRLPKSRSHWNDRRTVINDGVWECWDPHCDCHKLARLPYDWQNDPDLTTNTPT